MRNVTVLGGGNTAFAAAANLALRGFEITLCEHLSFSWTLEPLRPAPNIGLNGVAGQGTASIQRITTNFSEGLENDLLLLIVPAYAHRPFAEACAPHLREGHVVVILPGTLGTLEFARLVGADKEENPSVTLAETDTAPYVCRKIRPDSAHIWGVASSLGLGVFPATRTERVARLLAPLFTTDGLGSPAEGSGHESAGEMHPSAIERYSSVLECGLSAMNPVVHPAGVLMNAGRVEYSRGEFYFYEEGVTPGVCSAILALDLERRAVGQALGLELTPVDEAFHRAGFGPKGDLWAAINGSRMLTALRAPGGLNTRWLTEDVPYGLAAWCSIGEQFGVPTPLMRSLVELASATLGKDFWKCARTVKELGIEGISREMLRQYVETGNAA